jgi:hypothetical protein
VANTQKPACYRLAIRVYQMSGGHMVADNAVASSVKNDDCLENRLKDATPEDSRQLLEEFLKSFYLDKSEVAVAD